MSGSAAQAPEPCFRHEAFFYAGRDEFLAGTLPFLQDSVAKGEPALVVLNAAKIADLQAELGDDAHFIVFADMADVGANPARIIPAWREFIDDNTAKGRPLRGIGEPIWAERSQAELAECNRHEALLNAALDDPPFWLLCPYDTAALPGEVLDAAQRHHPFVKREGTSRPSTTYPGAEALAAPCNEPLSEPPDNALTLDFTGQALFELRRAVMKRASEAGLSAERSTELVIAVNEVASNSIVHGGGQGTLLVWHNLESVLCEVRDNGRILDSMVDRIRPDQRAKSGRGLWLANQICDLVQIRSGQLGTTVRLHMRLT
jgi:anti-sigma regulatory factor (Ser/Thr protein kinase)